MLLLAWWRFRKWLLGAWIGCFHGARCTTFTRCAAAPGAGARELNQFARRLADLDFPPAMMSVLGIRIIFAPGHARRNGRYPQPAALIKSSGTMNT